MSDDAMRSTLRGSAAASAVHEPATRTAATSAVAKHGHENRIEMIVAKRWRRVSTGRARLYLNERRDCETASHRRNHTRGSEMELTDQVALVTGAASGIGRAIARRFARAGARVVVADLDHGAATTTAREIDTDSRRALGIAMDVTDERAVDSGVAEVVSQLGHVDVLVSNAGIQIVHPLEEFSYAEWKKMLAIHLDGAFLTTRACLPHMYRAGRGSLIYMGSVHSKLASVLKAPYVT